MPVLTMHCTANDNETFMQGPGEKLIEHDETWLRCASTEAPSPYPCGLILKVPPTPARDAVMH